MTNQVTQELLDHIQAQNESRLAWAAEVEGRFVSTSPVDPEFWAERGVYTVKDLDRYTLESTISDVHKEAYGYRPRGYNFSGMSFEDLSELYDQWSADAQAAWKREQEEEAARIQNFEDEITALMEMGAGDRETAIRWYLDGLQLESWVLRDAGMLCYDLGLPYSMKDELRPIAETVYAMRESEAA